MLKRTVKPFNDSIIKQEKNIMIPAQFNAKEVEQKWYDYWMKNDYFTSKPDH